jgi:hypothetical protein
VDDGDEHEMDRKDPTQTVHVEAAWSKDTYEYVNLVKFEHLEGFCLMQRILKLHDLFLEAIRYLYMVILPSILTGHFHYE